MLNKLAVGHPEHSRLSDFVNMNNCISPNVSLPLLKTYCNTYLWFYS